jgi:hypothetical protein
MDRYEDLAVISRPRAPLAPDQRASRSGVADSGRGRHASGMRASHARPRQRLRAAPPARRSPPGSSVVFRCSTPHAPVHRSRPLTVVTGQRSRKPASANGGPSASSFRTPCRETESVGVLAVTADGPRAGANTIGYGPRRRSRPGPRLDRGRLSRRRPPSAARRRQRFATAAATAAAASRRDGQQTPSAVPAGRGRRQTPPREAAARGRHDVGHGVGRHESVQQPAVPEGGNIAPDSIRAGSARRS